MADKLAFALAGLSGFNAQGAGFLTAARELSHRRGEPHGSGSEKQ